MIIGKQVRKNLAYNICRFQLLVYCFLLAACAFNTPTHQTYSYQGPEGLNDSVGNQSIIAVTWTARSGSTTTATKPDTVILKADLIGPFRSIDEFLNWVRQTKDTNTTNGKTIVATAPDQTVDTWTNRTLTSYVSVPADLKSGYYDLRYIVVVHSSTGDAVKRSDFPAKIHCPVNDACSSVAK